MTRLSCNASSCVNYTGGFCAAATIHIIGDNAKTSKETNCSTFAERGVMNAFAGMANTNISGELRQFITMEEYALTPHILCEAEECRYNMKGRCSASNIQIIGEKAETTEETQCETFRGE